MLFILFVLLVVILIIVSENTGYLKKIKTQLERKKDQTNRLIDFINTRFDELAGKTKESAEPTPVSPPTPAPVPERLPEPSQKTEEPVSVPVSAYQQERIVRECTVHPPRKKTRFEEAVHDILRKIWSWILVGEDYRPKNVSMEYAVASTWLMRVGIIALVICIGYFLKWTIDKGLLGPSGRVAISVFAGSAMLVAGIKNLRTKYHILAQGFIGGGLAALYFSMYAAGPLYGLLPLPLVFVLMVVITTAAGLLSLKENAQLIAIFGIIGGFSTPLLLQTPDANVAILYGYMLLLGLGILGIAHVRSWRLLNYLGFIFTWLLFFASLARYEPSRDFTVTIVFLTLLFILHSVIVYYYNLLKAKRSTSLEIAHLLSNSFLYALVSYNLIIETHGRPWPAVMAIGLAAFYILHILVFLKRRVHDRNLLITLIGLAGFFTAWAVPLITEKETLTICWALQAIFFLWIGLKLNSNFLMTLAHILYFLVMVRIVYMDMPSNFYHRALEGIPLKEYWAILFERIWTFGVAIATFFGAFSLHKRNIKQIPEFAVDQENDIKESVSRSTFRELFFWGGVGFLFFFLYLEFSQMFTYFLPLQLPVLSFLWCMLGVYFLYTYMSRQQNVFLIAACVILGAVFLKFFFFDLVSWRVSWFSCIYHRGSVGVLMRLFDYGVIFLFLLMLLQVTTRKNKLIAYRRVFTVSSTALVFIYGSLEVNSFFHWYVPAFQEGAISVLWAIFAIAYLIIGIVKTSKAWRYSGLTLFVIVVAKVFLVDLADMEVLYRVIAFMILGVLLIGGSFAYLKANKQFKIEEETQ